MSEMNNSGKMFKGNVYIYIYTELLLGNFFIDYNPVITSV